MFNNFSFHEDVFNELIKRQERIPHAILISGAKGIGKLEFAFQLSQILLCEQSDSNSTPCGECHACCMLKAGTHPDLTKIELENSGTEKQAKEIKVDQIRVLCNKLAQTSQFGGYKIAIINPAESMNRNAANSLLKTLEEPALGTVIILISNQGAGARLPATIISRCQQIKLKKPSAEQVTAWLKLEYPGENLEELMAAADGIPKYVTEIVDMELLKLRIKSFEAFLAVAMQNKHPLAVAAVFHKSPANWVMMWLLSWVEDMLRLGSGSGLIINRDLQKSLQALAKRIDLHRLFEFYDQVIHTAQSLKGSANTQLLFETMLLKWSEIYHNTDK